MLDGLGLGLGLDDWLADGLDDGLEEGVEDGLEEGVADGLAGALDDALAEALEDALEVRVLGLGVAPAVLLDTAVSRAAHGFVAAGAGLAVPISKIPAAPAGMMKNPEITPNARVGTRRLLMDTPSPPWSSCPGRVRCHDDLSPPEAFPATLIRHLAGRPRGRLGVRARKTVVNDRAGHGGPMDAAG